MLEILDATSKKGISWYFRKRRMRRFLEYLHRLDKEKIYILDVGGTTFFWEQLGLANSDKIEIALLNLAPQTTTFSNMKFVTGDVADLNTYPQGPFDIIFSNSVIEHLFTYENQQKMASNILNAGTKVFIQTPNFYFPIEPHFMFPCFHFFSKQFRIFLLRNFSLGSYTKMTDNQSAEIAVDEIKLLRPRQMAELFPTLKIGYEKLFFMNKSIIAQNLY